MLKACFRGSRETLTNDHEGTGVEINNSRVDSSGTLHKFMKEEEKESFVQKAVAEGDPVTRT